MVLTQIHTQTDQQDKIESQETDPHKYETVIYLRDERKLVLLIVCMGKHSIGFPTLYQTLTSILDGQKY